MYRWHVWDMYSWIHRHSQAAESNSKRFVPMQHLQSKKMGKAVVSEQLANVQKLARMPMVMDPDNNPLDAS